MLPLIHIGSISIETYALMYSLAALAAGVFALNRARGTARLDDTWRLGALLVIASVLIGLWLPSFIVTRVQSLVTGQPPGHVQMRVYYGLALGVITLFIYARVRHTNALDRLDDVAQAFALAYAIGRIGCAAAGCCGGAVTDSPLGGWFPNEFGIWANRYPTQLISSLFQALCFVLLLYLDRQRAQHAWLRPPGMLFMIYLFLFAIERFSLDFLREDYLPRWGAISAPQAQMLALIVLAVVWAAWTLRKGARQETR